MAYSSKPFTRKKEQAKHEDNEPNVDMVNSDKEYSDDVNGNFLNVDLPDSEFDKIKSMLATNNNLNSLTLNEGFLKTGAISFLLLETDYHLSSIRDRASSGSSILRKLSLAQKMFQSFLDEGNVKGYEIGQVVNIIKRVGKKLGLCSDKGALVYALLSRAKFKVYNGISSIGDVSKKIFKKHSTVADLTKFAVTTSVMIIASCGLTKLWFSTGGKFLLNRAKQDISINITTYDKYSSISLRYNRTKLLTRSTVTNLSECGAIFRCIRADGSTFLLYDENSFITVPHSASVVAVQAFTYSSKYSKLIKVETTFPDLPTLTMQQGGIS